MQHLSCLIQTPVCTISRVFFFFLQLIPFWCMAEKKEDWDHFSCYFSEMLWYPSVKDTAQVESSSLSKLKENLHLLQGQYSCLWQFLGRSEWKIAFAAVVVLPCWAAELHHNHSHFPSSEGEGEKKVCWKGKRKKKKLTGCDKDNLIKGKWKREKRKQRLCTNTKRNVILYCPSASDVWPHPRKQGLNTCSGHLGRWMSS